MLYKSKLNVKERNSEYYEVFNTKKTVAGEVYGEMTAFALDGKELSYHKKKEIRMTESLLQRDFEAMP